MSRIGSKNTDLEKTVFSLLRRNHLKFNKHVKALPGKPDAVFVEQKVAVFVDGDFWHGYRFPSWEHILSDFWKNKIAKNRARDKRNFATLRRHGWKVIRIWGHQIKNDPDLVIAKVHNALIDKHLHKYS
ncbi:MAG: very short patch repair endonuclease [Terracidiphilus sp.]|jgi:DNA mismatch endonuclease (patch repair protein)